MRIWSNRKNIKNYFRNHIFTLNPHCETVSFFINSTKTRVLFIGSFVVLVVRVNVVCVDSDQKKKFTTLMPQQWAKINSVLFSKFFQAIEEISKNGGNNSHTTTSCIYHFTSTLLCSFIIEEILMQPYSTCTSLISKTS